MITIGTIATVAADGTLIIRVPGDIAPGKHKVVLVIAEEPEAKIERPPLDFPVRDWGPWPDNLSLRREEMYDDWGR